MKPIEDLWPLKNTITLCTIIWQPACFRWWASKKFLPSRNYDRQYIQLKCIFWTKQNGSFKFSTRKMDIHGNKKQLVIPSVSLSNWFSIPVHQWTLNSGRRTTSPPESGREVNHTDVSALCYVTATLKLHICLMLFVAAIYKILNIFDATMLIWLKWWLSPVAFFAQF
jgi:hypothetical protein